jgi:hypothetical protein
VLDLLAEFVTGRNTEDVSKSCQFSCQKYTINPDFGEAGETAAEEGCSIRKNEKPGKIWLFTVFRVVGLAGFEPTTPCPPGRCATRLRYSPFRERMAKETGEMRIGKHVKS